MSDEDVLMFALAIHAIVQGARAKHPLDESEAERRITEKVRKLLPSLRAVR